MAFPSEQTAKRFIYHLSAEKADYDMKPIRFYLLPDAQNNDQSWSSFYVVFFPKALGEDALHLWTILGEGMTTRHAEFLLGQIDYMVPECENQSFCTSAPAKGGVLSVPWENSAQLEKEKIRARIAHFATSERVDAVPISAKDVFLYDKGMSAIAAVARCLSTSVDRTPSNAVIYGYANGYMMIKRILLNALDGRIPKHPEQFDSLDFRNARISHSELPKNWMISKHSLHQASK